MNPPLIENELRSAFKDAVSVTSSVRGTGRLISSVPYDLTKFATISCQYLKRLFSRLNLSLVKRQDIFASISLSGNHNTYLLDKAYVLMYRWGSGELLNIPMYISCDNRLCLLVHHTQHNWLPYYPFLNVAYVMNNGYPISAFNSCSFVDGMWDEFRVEPLLADEQMPVYPLLGRDHWGHYILDHISKYYLSMLGGIIGRHSVLDVKHHRYNKQIDHLYNTIHSSCLWMGRRRCIPSSNFSIIGEISNCLLADMTPASAFFASVRSARNQSLEDDPNQYQQRNGKVLALVEPGMSQRIHNFDEYIAFLNSREIQIVNPSWVTSCSDPSGIYDSASVIISLFGSCLFGPLVYSSRPVVTLFPESIWSTGSPHVYQQFSDIIIFLGSYLFPVIGTALHPGPPNQGVNHPLSAPHHYSMKEVESALAEALGNC